MLSFLNQLKSFSRTTNAHQNPLVLDGGRGSLLFHRSRTSPYFMTGTLPPRLESEKPKGKDTRFPEQRSSSLAPPPHWHSAQDETFLVRSGRMVAIVSGRQYIIEKGKHVLIRRGEYHRFSNASTDQDLVVDVKLDPDNRLRDELFFRNAYGYQEDCLRAKISPSFFQFLLFLYSADIIPAFPGPKVIMAPISRFVTWFGGWIVRRLVFGYRTTYPEYTPKELQL